jgi:uncharacterized protein involved in exopolysaccharide biosynthesis
MVSNYRDSAGVPAAEDMMSMDVGAEGSPLISMLLKRWRLLFALGALFGVLGVAASFLVSKTYRVNTLVTVAEGDKLRLPSALSSSGLGDLAALAGLAPPAGEERSEALAILQSDFFLGRFIDSHKLAPQLYPRRWNEAAKQWKDGWLTSAPTRKETVRKFRKRALRVDEDRKTGLITVGLIWTAPQNADTVANSLIADLNETMRMRRIRESEARIAALQEQLDSTATTEVRTALFSLLQQELKVMTIARTRKDFALIVLDPAQKPDEYDRVGPQRFIWLFIGGFIGVALAALLAFLSDVRSARKQ